MNIREFTFNLNKVYEEMAATFSTYQKESGLGCLNNCGRCCLNPEVEASVLEMFPLALRLFDEGKLNEWLLKLENPTQDTCLLFVPGAGPGEGYCGSYNERPSVCRMFGVAGTFDKYHKATLSVCKFIKEENTIIAAPENKIPMIPEWYSRLSSLDPDLVHRKLPINQSIKEALQKIAFYAQYQEL